MTRKKQSKCWMVFISFLQMPGTRCRTTNEHWVSASLSYDVVFFFYSFLYSSRFSQLHRRWENMNIFHFIAYVRRTTRARVCGSSVGTLVRLENGGKSLKCFHFITIFFVFFALSYVRLVGIVASTSTCLVLNFGIKCARINVFALYPYFFVSFSCFSKSKTNTYFGKR